MIIHIDKKSAYRPGVCIIGSIAILIHVLNHLVVSKEILNSIKSPYACGLSNFDGIQACVLQDSTHQVVIIVAVIGKSYEY